MKNFIIRAITGIFFVSAIVVCFINPIAMAVLFALVTGLTVWEFTGLVNMRDGVDTNRFICTVAGVYLYFAMTGFCGSITPPTVFIPYLITIIYLLISELYAKSKDPINNWAYTMMTQMYIALPFSLLSVLAFRATPDGVAYIWLMPLSVFVFLWINDTGAYCCGSLFGRNKLFPRISPGKSWEGSAGGAVFVVAASALIWHLTEYYGINDLGLSIYEWMGSRGIRDMGRPRGKPLQTHTRGQGQRLNPAGPWRYARPVRLVIARHTRRCSISVYAHTVLITDRLYKK